MMKLIRQPFMIICMAVVLAGCSTTSPRALTRAKADLSIETLQNAEKLIKQAGLMEVFHDKDSTVAIVYRLRAAEIAWGTIEQRSGKVENMSELSADEKRALEILNRVEEVLALRFLNKDSSESNEYDFSHAGYRYHGSVAKPAGRGYYDSREFDSIKAAYRVPHKPCRRSIIDDGVGEPVTVRWCQPANKNLRRFVASRGYISPITAVLNFSPKARTGFARNVTLSFVDPTAVSSFRMGACDYPLAANYTAPIVQNTREFYELWLGIAGALDARVKEAKLIMTEPYDPNRIPVVLVHGLFSHPRMWRDVLNELRADPQLRGKYQYWLFYYPTGWPILYSASRLREEMVALEKTVGPQHNMVFIGHSLGGLLSRAQVISPERKIWNDMFKESADEKMAGLPADHLAKKMMTFKGNPGIGRVIFVCTPHRGSEIADWSLVGFVTRLIKLPVNIISATLDFGSEYQSKGGMTSISRLSPADPFYKSWEKIPIPVPYHSIIGDRGRGDVLNGSDGIVPYWSSHLEGARSELIVPGNHKAYKNPATIEEMKRILALHLASAKSRQAKPGLN